MKSTFKTIEKKKLKQIIGGGVITSPDTINLMDLFGAETGNAASILKPKSFIRILDNTQTSP